MVIVRPSHFLQEKEKAKAIHMLCLMAVGGQPGERKLTDRCSNFLQPISMMRQIWMASFPAKCVSVICHVERVDGKAHCWGRNGSRSCRGLTGPVTGPAVNKRNMRKYNSPSTSPPGLLPFQAILVEVAAVIVNQEHCLRHCCLGGGQTEIPLRQGFAPANLLHEHDDSRGETDTENSSCFCQHHIRSVFFVCGARDCLQIFRRGVRKE